ncbi:unnamed protein product, partial [marine sediment metagenome]
EKAAVVYRQAWKDRKVSKLAKDILYDAGLFDFDVTNPTMPIFEGVDVGVDIVANNIQHQIGDLTSGDLNFGCMTPGPPGVIYYTTVDQQTSKTRLHAYSIESGESVMISSQIAGAVSASYVVAMVCNQAEDSNSRFIAGFVADSSAANVKPFLFRFDTGVGVVNTNITVQNAGSVNGTSAIRSDTEAVKKLLIGQKVLLNGNRMVFVGAFSNRAAVYSMNCLSVTKFQAEDNTTIWEHFKTPTMTNTTR